MKLLRDRWRVFCFKRAFAHRNAAIDIGFRIIWASSGSGGYDAYPPGSFGYKRLKLAREVRMLQAEIWLQLGGGI